MSDNNPIIKNVGIDSNNQRKYVVKNNSFVENFCNQFSHDAYLLMEYTISKILKEDDPETIYNVPYSDYFYETKKIIRPGGKDILQLQRAFTDLCSYLGWWYSPEEESLQMISIFDPDSVSLNVNIKGSFRYRFSKRISELIFKQDKHYTQYHFLPLTFYHRKNSFVLHSLLKMSEYMHQDLEIEYMRFLNQFDCISKDGQIKSSLAYPSRVEEKIIKPVVEEINTVFPRAHVTYYFKKSGAEVEKIVFQAKRKLKFIDEEKDREINRELFYRLNLKRYSSPEEMPLSDEFDYKI